MRRTAQPSTNWGNMAKRLFRLEGDGGVKKGLQ